MLNFRATTIHRRWQFCNIKRVTKRPLTEKVFFYRIFMEWRSSLFISTNWAFGGNVLTQIGYLENCGEPMNQNAPVLVYK